jgi:hypothetical protein
LARGTTLDKVLELCARVAPTLKAPIVLFCYINPILSRGYEPFVQRVAACGVKGEREHSLESCFVTSEGYRIWLTPISIHIFSGNTAGNQRGSIVLEVIRNPYLIRHRQCWSRLLVCLGLLVPDIPLEETYAISAITKEYGMDLVLLSTPTTEPNRAIEIAKSTQGFLYLVGVGRLAQCVLKIYFPVNTWTWRTIKCAPHNYT